MSENAGIETTAAGLQGLAVSAGGGRVAVLLNGVDVSGALDNLSVSIDDDGQVNVYGRVRPGSAARLLIAGPRVNVQVGDLLSDDERALLAERWDAIGAQALGVGQTVGEVPDGVTPPGE